MSLWRRRPGVAYAAVFIAVIGHATSEFLSVLTGLGGPEMSVWRFFLGGVGLIALALLDRESRDLWTPLRHDGARIVALAVLGVVVSYLAFHWSLDYATVAQVATLITAIPVFVALIGAALARRRPTPVKLASGGLALAGVTLLITDGYLALLAGEGENLFGIALILVSAAAGALYLVLMRALIGEYGALRSTALTMMIGGAGLWLVVGLAFGNWVDFTTLAVKPWDVAVLILVLAFYNTTLTQFLWIGGLAAVPDMTRGSYLFFLKPVIATALVAAFLSQPLSALQILAALVICSTVAVELYWPRILLLFGRGALAKDRAGDI